MRTSTTNIYNDEDEDEEIALSYFDRISLFDLIFFFLCLSHPPYNSFHFILLLVIYPLQKERQPRNTHISHLHI